MEAFSYKLLFSLIIEEGICKYNLKPNLWMKVMNQSSHTQLHFFARVFSLVEFLSYVIMFYTTSGFQQLKKQL
jgi:hypothetical protein